MLLKLSLSHGIFLLVVDKAMKYQEECNIPNPLASFLIINITIKLF